jgi:hypothetical protein
MESFLTAYYAKSLKHDSSVKDADEFSPSLAFFPPNPSNLSLNSFVLDTPSLVLDDSSFIELPSLPNNIVVDPTISKCI